MDNNCKIIELREVDSTNTYAREHLSVFDDKTIVTADSQTKGRGRFQCVWSSSEQDDIYMTIVLKPNCNDVFKNITQYAGLVVSKTLDSYGVKTTIKWPNDIMIDNKKICGILCESVFIGDKPKGLLIGIGVNLNKSQEELDKIDKPATALNLELRHNKIETIDKKEFTKKLLEEFFLYYDIFINRGFVFIKQDYESRTNFISKEVLIDGSKRLIEGLTDDGELIFTDTNGERKTITTGEMMIC